MALKRRKKPVEFKRLRELAGLTISETSDLIKVALGSVYRYECGDSRPFRLALDTLRQAAERRLAAEDGPTGFRFIDLFAGIGGLRLNFQGTGDRCVFTSEWDRKCEILRKRL